MELVKKGLFFKTSRNRQERLLLVWSSFKKRHSFEDSLSREETYFFVCFLNDLIQSNATGFSKLEKRYFLSSVFEMNECSEEKSLFEKISS